MTQGSRLIAALSRLLDLKNNLAGRHPNTSSLTLYASRRQ
jgi:hypothetical protein